MEGSEAGIEPDAPATWFICIHMTNRYIHDEVDRQEVYMREELETALRGHRCPGTVRLGEGISLLTVASSRQ
jgi:hypothetical protein